MREKLFELFKNNRKICLIIILLWTSLVYGNIFPNEFVVDDKHFIVNWPMIRDLSNWPQFFGSKSQPIGEEGVYSPLKTCIHALNYHLWGLKPFGHHLVTIITHLLGTFFVYKIALFLSKNNFTAFLCGLFFGLHPVHVEAHQSSYSQCRYAGCCFLYYLFLLLYYGHAK